jgi:transglutaminase-like putative cysteine protease
MMPALKGFVHKLADLVDIWTIARLVLLWLAIGITTWGLVTALPALQGTGLWWIGLCASLIGYLLTRSRMPGWTSAFLLPIMGGLLLVLTIGRLIIPLRTLLSALVPPAIDNSAYARGLAAAWNGIEIAASSLVTRFSVWSTAFSGRRLTNDTIMNTLVWGSVLWLVAGWAGWWVGRYKVAVASLVPAAGLLGGLYYYYNLKSIAFLALLGGTIVLLEGVSGFGVAFQRWQKKRLDRAEYVTQETLINILGMAFLLMVTGWALASIPLEKITDNIQKYLEERRNGNSSQTTNQEQIPSAPMIFQNRFPSMTTINFEVAGYPKLTDQIVMYVSVEGYQPRPDTAQNDPQAQSIAQPYYWRTLTYDEYEIDGWHNSINGVNDYTAGDALPSGQLVSSTSVYQLVRQHVKYVDTQGGLVVTAGQMITLDQAYYVYWRSPGDMISAQTEALDYTVDSRLPTATADQLRQAGTDYPASLNKYLQLPDGLPLRVSTLAFDLTATQLTPYDKVIAIQTYLRSFPYTLDVPAPPEGREITDFFLFDLKKGYCDYYATAMAVMARVIGVPARLVTGFSSGRYDEQTGSFVVKANNAHAWVEIYFPGTGWVEFEPTAGSPAAELPGSGETVSQTTPAPVPTAGKGGNGVNITSLTKPSRGKNALLFAAALVILLIILSFSAERSILLLCPSDRAVTNIYRRLYRLGSRWFPGNTRTYTPNEFASELSAHLVGQYNKRHLPPTVIAARMELAWLTDLYNRTLYSSCSPTRLEQRRAVQVWFLLRRHLSWLHFEKAIAFLKRPVRTNKRTSRAKRSHGRV